MKGIISLCAALAVITSSLGTVPFKASAETAVLTASAAEESVEYDLSSPKSHSEKDGIYYDIFDGYAAVDEVKTEDIEEFTVPETIDGLPVVGVQWGAFRNCRNIRKITLTKNVHIYDWSDVAEQTIEEIAVSDDNENYIVADGVLYSKDKKTVVAFPPANSAEEVKLAEEAETIAPYAFISCQNLKKIELGKNITEIGPGAFAGCINAESINIPDGVKAINNGAFMGTKALKELTIPDSVENVYFEAFKDCGAIENESGIDYVDKWAVGSDDDIERAYIRNGTVGTIEGLFSGKTQLKVVTVPESVLHIGRYLILGIYSPVERVDFYCHEIPDRCIGGLSVRMVCVNDPDCKIADSATALPSYWREPKEAPESKTEIDEDNDYTIKHTSVSSSNSGASSVQKALNTSIIEIDTGKEETDEEAKERIAKYLETHQPVTYSAPIKIGNPAKYDTLIVGHAGSTAEEYALKYRRIFDAFEPVNTTVGPEIVDDRENGIVYWIYNSEYAKARISANRVADKNAVPKEITIPESVNNVPVRSLSVVQSKSDIIHIPATVEDYVSYVDSAEDGAAYYDVDKDNPYLTSVDGIIYSKDMTKLIRVPSRYAGKKIVVPDGVKTIDNFAFFSLDNVESIELPDSVEIIGRCAFSASRKLETVRLSENLDIISDNAFSECNALKNATIPESVRYVGCEAFTGTSVVKYENGLGYLDGWFVGTERSSDAYYKGDIAIKEGTVGVASFGATGNVTIPSSVTKMSWEMIESGDALTRADVYSHVLDYDAFKSADFLKDIYIYDPECEICAGSQTIRAKHYERINNLIGIQKAKYHEQYSDARTYASELEEVTGRTLKDTVIHGYKGSTAEAYANMYGIEFEALDGTKQYKDGDLNGDGDLTVGDLIIMNRYIHGTYSFTEDQFKSADLNGDGNADIFDVLVFRRKLLED